MVQGKLRLKVGDAETVMGRDDIVVIPPNTPHEAEALEDTVVIDIFSPPWEDFLTGNVPTYLQAQKQLAHLLSTMISLNRVLPTFRALWVTGIRKSPETRSRPSSRKK